MASLTITLPSQERQSALNLERWDELLEDPDLAAIEARIETDRHGNIVMSPLPAARHGRLQAKIARLLGASMNDGDVITECPISTSDGVKGADVAWASPERLAELGDKAVFPHAPEICVEILSPRNTPAQMKEKTDLYFDAGAQEVWHCSAEGDLTFYLRRESTHESTQASMLCPKFPVRVDVG